MDRRAAGERREQVLYKRGRVWWVKIAVGGEKPVRESTFTADPELAQEFHDRRAAELWRVHRLGERPRVALADAALDWLTTHSVHKRSHEDDRLRLSTMLPYLPDGPVDALTTGAMTTIRDALRADRGISAATANRYLAILSAILHHAHRREQLAAVPYVPFLRVEQRAVPMVPADAVERLLAALPRHLRLMAVVALSTGLRQANVRLLRWDQVDFAARVIRIEPDEAKAGRAIVVPLPTDAVAALRLALGEHERYCFVWHGKRIAGKLTNTAWRRAIVDAGLAGLRWHDLRHVWATRLAAAGVPEQHRQEWGGWRTAGMARRYTHLAGQHLVEYADAAPLRSTIRAQSDSTGGGDSPQVVDSLGWLRGLEPPTTGITKRKA